MNPSSPRRLVALTLCLLCAAQTTFTQTTKKRAATTASAPVSCDQQRALALVQQQAADARSFEKPLGQISVMTRAAELLWPYEQAAARAVFADAFQRATTHFLAKGDEAKHEGRGAMIILPDQRVVVMRAIARRDAEWARKLALEAAEDTRRAAETKSTPAPQVLGVQSPGYKLLELATPLLAINQPVALELIRKSFAYPANVTQARLFYELAAANRTLADELAREAITTYARKGTTEDLSFVSVYAFGLPGAISPLTMMMHYTVPPGFEPNAALQELALKAYMARAETLLKNPEQHAENPNKFWPEPMQMLVALTTLESLAAERFPAYAERIAALKSNMHTANNEKEQQRAAEFLQGRRDREKESKFDSLIEEIEREAKPEKKERLIANAAQVADTITQLEQVESLAQKIGESEARRQLSNWLNFKRAQLLVKEARLDEAKIVADTIDELDHRAILYFEIAREGIKKLEDKLRARQLLDEVATAAGKAPNTDVKARTLLGITHLLAEFDALRAAEVLSDAVKTINALDNPELSMGFILRRIEGKNFSVYSGYNIPGFNLENSFRELGPRDFDGALALARNLSDRTLRSTAILGLSSQCLEQAPPQQPAAPLKKDAPGTTTRKPGDS
ncbi:MAG TPA: hypothetical protein VEY11_09725 [Pyrinomonadaceae bacterium]|nr:hypothetical protein [Pyrinomonadaceae bacterium]